MVLTFAGIDHVSALLVPYGTTFQAASGTARIFGISAAAVASDLSTLLLLCDRGEILEVSAAFGNRSISLSSLSWLDRREIIGRDQKGDRLQLDAEGLAFDGKRRRVWLSTEPSRLLRLPDWNTDPWVHPGPLEAELLPHQPSEYFAGELPNLGLEALTALRSNESTASLVTGLEGPLIQDDSRVRRVYEVDPESGQLLRAKIFLLDSAEGLGPQLLLSELVSLDSQGLGGGQFLALARSWSRKDGNDIRLYLIQSEGSDDVSNCSAICDGDCAFQGSGQCYLQELRVMQKELLFRWTPTAPLAGTVAVDNYEAMTIIPPEAFGFDSDVELGGIALLLVNDNNDNPRQIGTQFVLLRLAFSLPQPTVGSNVLLLLLSVSSCVLLIALAYCFFRSRKTARRWRFQDLPEEGPGQDDMAVTIGRV